MKSYDAPDEFIPFVSDDVIQKERRIAKELKKTIWWKNKRASGICHYCRGKFEVADLTMDHLIPLNRGGTSIKANLVPCCKNCNNNKKYSLPQEFQPNHD
ncbi:HNH endonuclease [Leptospira sp. GIMC2001]|uniref:HNH endonuclease n=1 Tax=Leptospira sp. GIMC2001 TaxID=1513297 RepID=UPI00234A31F2|nr:HNH endonuclease signature motif containing protein [Leptospira sp. GIMC2001]WCL50237.1 HNH endonuclease signature motif containing protein [Leptospira sp. GIMC2001]